MSAVPPGQSRGSVSRDSDEEDVEKKKSFWGHVKHLAKSKTASGRVDTMQRETAGKIVSLLQFFSQLPQMRTSRVDPNKTAAFLMSQKGSPQKKNTLLADAELARQVRVGVKRDGKTELDDSQVLALRCLRDVMPRVHGRSGEKGDKRPENYYQVLGSLTEHALDKMVNERGYNVLDFICIVKEIGKVLQIESEKLQRVSLQLKSPSLPKNKIDEFKGAKASLEESVSHLETLLKPIMERIKINSSDEGADLRPDPAGMSPSYAVSVSPARTPQFAVSLMKPEKLTEAGDRLFAKALAMNADTAGGYEHRTALLTGWFETVKELAPTGLATRDLAIDALAFRISDRPDGIHALLASLPARDLASIHDPEPPDQMLLDTRVAFMSAVKEAYDTRVRADLAFSVAEVRRAVQEQADRYKHTLTRTNKPADLVISAALAFATVRENLPEDPALEAARTALNRLVNSQTANWETLPPAMRSDFIGALRSMGIELASSSTDGSPGAVPTGDQDGKPDNSHFRPLAPSPVKKAGDFRAGYQGEAPPWVAKQ